MWFSNLNFRFSNVNGKCPFSKCFHCIFSRVGNESRFFWTFFLTLSSNNCKFCTILFSPTYKFWFLSKRAIIHCRQLSGFHKNWCFRQFLSLLFGTFKSNICFQFYSSFNLFYSEWRFKKLLMLYLRRKEILLRSRTQASQCFHMMNLPFLWSLSVKRRHNNRPPHNVTRNHPGF